MEAEHIAVPQHSPRPPGHYNGLPLDSDPSVLCSPSSDATRSQSAAGPKGSRYKPWPVSALPKACQCFPRHVGQSQGASVTHSPRLQHSAPIPLTLAHWTPAPFSQGLLLSEPFLTGKTVGLLL